MPVSDAKPRRSYENLDSARHGDRVANRPLSQDALLRRQQLETAGELKEDQVVVASVQPLELGFEAYEAAKQVRQNVDNNIRYVYFFEGNPDATDKIPQLLQLLLLAPFPGEKGRSLLQEATQSS